MESNNGNENYYTFFCFLTYIINISENRRRKRFQLNLISLQTVHPPSEVQHSNLARFKLRTLSFFYLTKQQ